MAPRLAPLVLALALLLSPLAGVAQAVPADGTSARAAAGASFAKPLVGECHTYTRKQLDKRSEPSAPVACEGPHTAQTIAVLKLKGKVGSTSALRKLPTCAKALRKVVGPELARTSYSLSFFLPTKGQVKKGAKWLRCDVTLRAGKTLAPLPTPLVTSPLTDAVGACAVIVKGVTQPTVCAAKHDYRYTASVKLSGTTYPGAQKVLRASILKCAKKVSTPKRFWAFYPSAGEWKAGYREVACLSLTTS